MKCPGGRAINVDRDRWEAQCPHCEYTFSTVVDEPVVPPHYVNPDGSVTFTLGPGQVYVPGVGIRGTGLEDDDV